MLFSETLEWALSLGLVDARQLSERDPLLFFALPRLAVLVGCLLLPNSPIGPNRLNAGYVPTSTPLLPLGSSGLVSASLSPFSFSASLTPISFTVFVFRQFDYIYLRNTSFCCK